MICLAVIVRKQWEDHERFAFPIMQVPLAVSETGNGGLGRLFRSRLMWAGFAIPFVIGSINALHHYFHTVPRIDLVHDIWIFNGTTPLRLRLHFAILGYSYFVNTDVSLSIWVFNVISKVVRGILAVLGAERYNVSGVVGRFSSQGHASLALMGMGYMVILAAYSLWVGREHLRQVAAKALGRPSAADDSEEVMPYRTALIGIGGGTLYLGCWLYQAGMSPPVILMLFASCFIVFLVMARIVSETGFVTAYSPINPAEVRRVYGGIVGFQSVRPRDAGVRLRLDDDTDQHADAPRGRRALACPQDSTQTGSVLGNGCGPGGGPDHREHDDAQTWLRPWRAQPGPALSGLRAPSVRCLCGPPHARAES